MREFIIDACIMEILRGRLKLCIINGITIQCIVNADGEVMKLICP